MKLENKILDIKNKVKSIGVDAPNLNEVSYPVRFVIHAMASRNMFLDIIRALRNGSSNPRIFLF